MKLHGMDRVGRREDGGLIMSFLLGLGDDSNLVRRKGAIDIDEAKRWFLNRVIQGYNYLV